MKDLKKMMGWVVVFWVMSGWAYAVGPMTEDLRLRTGDSQQELQTTSLNWFDLNEFYIKRLKHPINKDAFQAQPKVNFRVMIDAGHGGHDLGAPGFHGIQEKQLVLTLSRMIRDQLKSYSRLNGFALEVKMTRDKDQFIGLKERVRLANEWGADLFLSVHANSSPVKSVKGFEVYFLSQEASDSAAQELAEKENQSVGPQEVSSGVLSILHDVQTNLHIRESGQFAEVVYQSMENRLRPNKRGVRQAPFTVLVGTAMPALLVEVGYVSNQIEAKQLKKGYYLKRIADAISSGIVSFARKLRKVS